MLLIFCVSANAQAEVKEEQTVVKKSVAKPAKEAPTKIRSDIIDIKRKSQTVNFIGNVVIEKEDSTLLSQKMTVLYDEKKESKKSNKISEDPVGSTSDGSVEPQSGKQSSIKKIYTDEKVKIFNEEFVATGDSGYYDPKEDTFVLEKNVVVNNGVSLAKGDKFVHHISTKKSNFVGRKEDKTLDEDKRVVVILGDDAKEFKKTKKKNNE